MIDGSIVALITPFKKDLSIDLQAYQKMLELHLDSGTQAIVCCGTTGEAPTLSNEEREMLIKTAVERVSGKVPVIAYTGSASTADATEKTKRAKELGADYALVIVPYYNCPTSRGCIAHFDSLKKCELPVIAYHHPGRTGIKLGYETLSEIVCMPHIVGVKDASGDKTLTTRLSEITAVYSGNDGDFVEMMQSGSKGVISVMANILPKAWNEIASLCLENRFDKAKELYGYYKPLCDAVFSEVNPQGIKWGMHLQGYCLPQYRLPLVTPEIQNQKWIASELANLQSTAVMN